MIETLRVRGVGGIDAAVLDFTGRFIVITGESGSGKSSLVRALEFLSGRRAQLSSIRSGADEAVVEALWSPIDGEDEAVTRRSLSRAGKGRVAIRGAMATAGELAAFCAPRLGIQSQFAQLDLLDPARQLELVDLCGGEALLAAKSRLAEVFPEMLAAERAILDVKRRQAEVERALEGAPARVRQIRALQLRPESEREWASELETVERQLKDADRYEGLVRRMQGGDQEVDLTEQIALLLREAYAVAPEESLARWTELGETALSSLQELFAAVRSELGVLPREALEEAQEKLEARLGALRRLKRETGLDSSAALLAYLDEVEGQNAWLRDSRGEMERLQARAAELRTETAALARSLRSLREAAAKRFEASVNRHLGDLAMTDVRFSVLVNRLEKVRATGAETVAFLLAQKDLPPGPVSRVASGGELSRILIAIQASMEPERLPSTLVFDEVEAGLGGRTALLAGEKLREISRHCQTVLITHEATIAAMADQHFLVSRKGDETEVRGISGEQRIAEIARMLAGSDTPEALDHARALLERRNL